MTNSYVNLKRRPSRRKMFRNSLVGWEFFDSDVISRRSLFDKDFIFKSNNTNYFTNYTFLSENVTHFFPRTLHISFRITFLSENVYTFLSENVTHFFPRMLHISFRECYTFLSENVTHFFPRMLHISFRECYTFLSENVTHFFPRMLHISFRECYTFLSENVTHFFPRMLHISFRKYSFPKMLHIPFRKYSFPKIFLSAFLSENIPFRIPFRESFTYLIPKIMIIISISISQLDVYHFYLLFYKALQCLQVLIYVFSYIF